MQFAFQHPFHSTKRCAPFFLQSTHTTGIFSSSEKVPLGFFCTISAHFPQPSPLCFWARGSSVCPWHLLSRHCIMKMKPALVSALMKFSFSLLVLLLPFSKYYARINAHLYHHLSHQSHYFYNQKQTKNLFHLWKWNPLKKRYLTIISIPGN